MVCSNPVNRIDPYGLQSDVDLDALNIVIEALNDEIKKAYDAGDHDLVKRLQFERNVFRKDREIHVARHYSRSSHVLRGTKERRKARRMFENQMRETYAKALRRGAKKGSTRIPIIGFFISFGLNAIWPPESFADMVNDRTWPLPVADWMGIEDIKPPSPKQIELESQIDSLRLLKGNPHFDRGEGLDYLIKELQNERACLLTLGQLEQFDDSGLINIIDGVNLDGNYRSDYDGVDDDLRWDIPSDVSSHKGFP